jgi:hypothetical protein
MDNGVLLETKTLVELTRHYIQDQVRAFSVFHPSEWHTKYVIFIVVLKIQMVFDSYLTLEIKWKHLKDILR